MHSFVRIGPTYRPADILGWIVTLLAMAFVVNCFIAIDRNAHSVSDTFYGLFPYAGVTFLLWDWLAQRLTRQPA